MERLQIEYVPVSELKAYARNAKEHPDWQVEQLIESVQSFDFADPIAVWKDNEIIEGHGRLMAAQQMGLLEVPVIRLDYLTEEQVKAYRLVHNKLTMNSGFDLDILQEELESIIGIDMEQFGFEDFNIDGALDDDELDASKYSQNAKIPQYEVQGELPEVTDLFDDSKTKELFEDIERADIPEDVRMFLRMAAHRHTVFNYKKIAEFYAHADAEVQQLMEDSALVIIDINDAIANGFVKLTKTIQDLINEDEDDA